MKHIEVMMEHKYMQNSLTQALTTLSNVMPYFTSVTPPL